METELRMPDPVAVSKTFTIQEVIDAIAANGLEHLRAQWISTTDGKLTGGCVLMQGALNLGVVPYSDEISPEDVLFGLLPKTKATYYEYGEPIEYEDVYIVSSLVEALDGFFSYDLSTNSYDLSTKWSKGPYEFDVVPGRLGSRIIFWNDLLKLDDRGRLVEPTEYYIKTYAEVAKMAEEILTPYRKEVITLQTIDYSGVL